MTPSPCISSPCSVENESRSVVSNPLGPHGLYNPWNSPGQNTGVGSLSLLQGLFPTQGSNRGLPHCGQILSQLSHKGSPKMLELVAYPSLPGIFPTQELNQGLLHCRQILHQLSYEGSLCSVTPLYLYGLLPTLLLSHFCHRRSTVQMINPNSVFQLPALIQCPLLMYQGCLPFITAMAHLLSGCLWHFHLFPSWAHLALQRKTGDIRILGQAGNTPGSQDWLQSSREHQWERVPGPFLCLPGHQGGKGEVGRQFMEH